MHVDIDVQIDAYRDGSEYVRCREGRVQEEATHVYRYIDIYGMLCYLYIYIYMLAYRDGAEHVRGREGKKSIDIDIDRYKYRYRYR